MFSKSLCCLLAGSLMALAAGQPVTNTVPVPADPLELVTAQVRPIAGPSARTAVLSLLGRARDRYDLKNAGHAWDLKTTFTVNSGGQTEYDGTWQMEDIFDPKLGLRWTAKASAAYSITRISSNGTLYGEQTGSYVPLRLAEARAALFDPIPPAASVAQASIRTANAMLGGVQLTCILFSGSGSNSGTSTNTTPGRHWMETEDCVDPQSGLLRVHSQVPGRYYLYDYSGGLQLNGRMLPSHVAVTEGGKTVTEISVDSLSDLPSSDPSLFVPTDEMKARGQATVLGGAQKLSIVSGQSSPGATAHVVCVFGVVTADGQLVEAHSLQPSDPNSQAAVDAARQMNFASMSATSTRPQQHFAFIVARFFSPQQ